MDNTRKLFREINADAMLTRSEDLRKYLTGFASSFGFVYTDTQDSVFFTDPRYAEAAKAALKQTSIAVEIAKDLDSVLRFVKTKKVKKIAVPFERLTLPEYDALCRARLKPVDSMPAFTAAMIVKTEGEIAAIRRACKIAEDGYMALLNELKEGMTENEVAALLEYHMRRCGAEDRSFETIAAFGKNTSVPHHHSGQDKLACGMPVLLDFGCRVDGYCSDITRTFLFGKKGAPDDFAEMYEAVYGAHMAAAEQIRGGITGAQADEIARGFLRKKELDKFFTHSLGHGIGINIHEKPVIGPSGKDVLRDGMVFSIEPGVYFEGLYGIRIEDTAALLGGKPVSFMKTDKRLTVL